MDFVTIEIHLVVQAFLTDKYIPIGDMGMDIAHNVTGKIVKDGAKMSFMHAVQKGTFRTWILMRSYILLHTDMLDYLEGFGILQLRFLKVYLL